MSAYILEGPRWSSTTVTWSFAAQTDAEDSADPFSSTISSAAYQAVVEKAVAKWQSVSGLDFVQVPDSTVPSQGANIRIGFGLLGSSTAGEIGQTTYYAANNVFQPDVVIRLEDPSQMPLVSTTAGYVYSGTATTLYQVVLHELGHALGLNHDADTQSVMYPVAGASNRDLDATDVAGIQALYGAPPATATVAASTNASTTASTSATDSPVSSVSTTGVVTLQGGHNQYVVAATPSGALYVQDDVPGRDGTQIVSGASQIVFSDGTARFDPDGAAADVARLYAAALDRQADLGGLNYWTSVVESGTSLVSVANTLAASPEFVADYGALSDTGFVQLLYQQVLGHAADAGGLQYWLDDLGAGASRGDVLLGFANSDEARADASSYAGDADDAEAYRLYQAALDRTPDTGGMDYWSDMLRAGTTPLQVAQSFLATPEYAQAYGSPDSAGFVNELYENVLHRAADSAGAQYWAGALQAGASRAAVLLGFSDSQENRLATAPATHANWVFIAG